MPKVSNAHREERRRQIVDGLDAIGRFAGDELTKAKYYDFDPDFLLELEPEVTHCDVVD